MGTKLPSNNSNLILAQTESCKWEIGKRVVVVVVVVVGGGGGGGGGGGH